MAAVHVAWHLLGRGAAMVDDEPVVVRTDRSRAVLVFLLLRAGTHVSTERLIEALWPDNAPKTARNSVQRFVADLRQDLESASGRIETVAGGYLLRLEPGDEIDADRAAQQLRTALSFHEDDQHAATLAALPPELDEWTQPIPGLDGVEFVRLEQMRLDELVADCLELRVSSQLAAGRNAEAAREAKALVERYPFREGAWADLMVALYRTDRVGEALTAYQQLHAMMLDELGCTPSPRLQGLERQMLGHDASLLDLSTEQVRQTTFPDMHLVGREQDVGVVRQILSDRRLVTITGPGGIGKTSLATVVASEWAAESGRPVHLVSFAEASASSVLGVLGETVGISTRADEDPLLEVLDRLRAESGLLVLDNCEDETETVRTLLGAVGVHAPSVRVLATSRTPIGVPSEHVVSLGPLSPEAGRALFEERAGHRDLGDHRDRDELINKICERLDGVPLAIELAASALRALGLVELLGHLDYPASNLVDEYGDLPERHRSMDAALGWSLDRLDGKAFRLLVDATEFGGSFTLEALGTIVGADHGDVINELIRLVHHSLVHVDRANGQARYRILVPIRDRLRTHRTNSDPVQKRFIGYYVDLAERALAKMKGPDPVAGFTVLRDELPNLRTAFELVDRADDVASMARLGRAVGFSAGFTPEIQAHSTIRTWIPRLATRLDAETGERARRLEHALIYARAGSGDWKPLRAIAEVGRLEPLAAVLVGSIMFGTGEAEAAWELLAPIDLTAIEDPYERAMANSLTAVIAFTNASIAGVDMVELAVETAAGSNSPATQFWADMAVSTRTALEGDIDRALEVLTKTSHSLEGHQLHSLRNQLRSSMVFLTLIYNHGDPTDLLADQIGQYVGQNSISLIESVWTLDACMLVLSRAGRSRDAARLLGMLTRLGVSFGLLRPLRLDFERAVETDPDLLELKSQGETGSTIDVLSATHAALLELSEA